MTNIAFGICTHLKFNHAGQWVILSVSSLFERTYFRVISTRKSPFSLDFWLEKPDAPCIEYLPTFTPKMAQSCRDSCSSTMEHMGNIAHDLRFSWILEGPPLPRAHTILGKCRWTNSRSGHASRSVFRNQETLWETHMCFIYITWHRVRFSRVQGVIIIIAMLHVHTA